MSHSCVTEEQARLHSEEGPHDNLCSSMPHESSDACPLSLFSVCQPVVVVVSVSVREIQHCCPHSLPPTRQMLKANCVLGLCMHAGWSTSLHRISTCCFGLTLCSVHGRSGRIIGHEISHQPISALNKPSVIGQLNDGTEYGPLN